MANKSSTKSLEPVIVDFDKLDVDIQELIKEAVVARELAYCPYSRFKVGAAVLCSDGAVFSGCNVENVAHTTTICGERTAVVKAASVGNRTYAALAVVAVLEDWPEEFVSPCGPCRQFVAEFGTDVAVYMARPDHQKVQVSSIRELLPFTFHLR